MSPLKIQPNRPHQQIVSIVASLICFSAVYLSMQFVDRLFFCSFYLSRLMWISYKNTPNWIATIYSISTEIFRDNFWKNAHSSVRSERLSKTSLTQRLFVAVCVKEICTEFNIFLACHGKCHFNRSLQYENVVIFHSFIRNVTY